MTPVQTEFRRQYSNLALRGLELARDAWGQSFDNWGEAVPTLTRDVARLQLFAATVGSDMVNARLVEQGNWMPGDWLVDPFGFAGWTSDGRPLERLLWGARREMDRALDAGWAASRAWTRGEQFLDRHVPTEIMDAMRGASGLEIAARTTLGWRRMVVLDENTCDMCIVLAGKVFFGAHHREAFARHSFCRCWNEPAVVDRADRDSFLEAQRDAFDALTPEQQDRAFGRYNAEAIRAGADIGQVVNRRYRGDQSGLGGHAGVVTGGRASRRPAPEELYHLAGGDRFEFERLLMQWGYLRNADGSLSRPGRVF